LQNENVYYRIEAYLSNGTREYSPIARLIPQEINKPTLIFDLTNKIWKLSLPDDWQSGKVVIYDIQGKEVFVRKLSNEKMIDLNPQVIPGVYFIEINAGNDSWSDKIVW
jgi:hypothetical protein